MNCQNLPGAEAVDWARRETDGCDLWAWQVRTVNDGPLRLRERMGPTKERNGFGERRK